MVIAVNANFSSASKQRPLYKVSGCQLRACSIVSGCPGSSEAVSCWSSCSFVVITWFWMTVMSRRCGIGWSWLPQRSQSFLTCTSSISLWPRRPRCTWPCLPQGPLPCHTAGVSTAERRHCKATHPFTRTVN